MQKLLAKVKAVDLTISRGCMMVDLDVAYENGWNQSVMAYSLDIYNKETQSREGTAYGCEMLRRLLSCFGVRSLQDIKGKHVWVMVDKEGVSQKPLGLERLRVDAEKKPEPFIFSEVLEQFDTKE